MSVLTNLKLVAAKKPAKQPPVVQRRNKLSNKLWEQVQLARAQKSGETFLPTRMRSVRDPETGLRKDVEVPKRVKPWWFVADNGKVCLSVKYGAKVLELAKGKTEFSFDVVTRHGDPRSYQYKVIGEELLSLPVGQLKAIRIERVGKNLDKQVVAWVAPELDYLLVKLWQAEDKVEQFDVQLQSYQFN